jgi:hypothetical protein
VHTDFFCCFCRNTVHHIVIKTIVVPCIMSILLVAYAVLVFTSYIKFQTGSDVFEYWRELLNIFIDYRFTYI